MPNISTSKIRFLIYHIINIVFLSGVNGQEKSLSLNLIKTVPLAGIHGKFDHMAVDSKNNKLYLAAKGNNSVEIVDLTSGKTIYSIKEVSAPQGILFMPNENMILVCGGGDGTLKGFDAVTYKQKFVLQLGSEADNIRYSPARQRLYVAFGDGAIAVIDAHTFKKESVIHCTAHPEAFSLDSSSKKMWVNVPDKGLIKVINIDSEKEITSWKTGSHQDNFPMALIENSHKLIVASRSNPVISILNSETGKMLQSFTCDSDPDAMFYDKMSGKVFISCGGGSIYILNNIKDLINKPVIIPTRKGARTCLWVSELKALFVALPEVDGKIAEIRLYQ